MATLKGQNFRIGRYSSAPHEFEVFANSTNCTVNLTTNTSDVSTKDDVGMSTKNAITTKGWNISIETLSVMNAAELLTAMKNQVLFSVMWAEVETTDNATPVPATFHRRGTAYITDITLTFNDRNFAVTNIQMTGTGELYKVTSDDYEGHIPSSSGTFTKGHFVRLFLGSDNSETPAKVIAAAKTLSFHVSMTTESATTKDTESDWDVQEVTGMSFDISSNALVRSDETISSSVAAQDLESIEDIYEASTPVRFQIANVSGANNRTKGSIIVSGSVIITQLTLNGPNRQNADYTAQLTGYGAYTVGA